MPRQLTPVVALAIATCLVTGCDLLDPIRPTPQPDTEVFGNLIETTPSPDNPGVVVATIRVGVPRDLVRSETESGAVPPELDQGIVATVTVGDDTVVLGQGRPAALADLTPGTEVVVLPVPGTTFMIGSSSITVEAAMLLDFSTYKRWRLPKLTSSDSPAARVDPAVVNSDGVELAPVPVAGGRVLYFSAHLRPPALADGAWQGARRDGLSDGTDGQPPRERSYRTELSATGWSAPAPVALPGLDDAVSVRVSWVAADETSLLVTISAADTLPWVGLSRRAGPTQPWGAVERLDRLGEDASDGVFLAGSSTKLTFTSGRGGGNQSDLFLADLDTEDAPLPLEPKVNTVGDEWAPRVGPANQLYFMRGDRQMLLVGGSLSSLRLPGPNRTVFSQAAVTDDGAWAFFCLPGFVPVELDQDIYVASLDANGFGQPVPVDEWRPPAE